MNNITNVPKMKTCSKCKEEKPLTTEYFSTRKDSMDGFRGVCKDCRSEHGAKYYKENKKYIAERRKKHREENKEYYKERNKVYYKENKEYLIERNIKYYEENKESVVERKKLYYKENKKRIAIKNKLYYEKNRESVIETNKRYREKNKEHLQERARQYRKENLHAIRINNQRRKAIKKKLSHTLTVEQWDEIKSHFNNSCSYCGMTEEMHMKEFSESLHQEHFIPLNKGGEYTHNNIVPSCKTCNSSKHDKNFFGWYPTHESYSRTREKKILEFLGYNNEGFQQLSIL